MTTIDKIRAEIKKLQDIFVETAQGMETEDEATVYSMCAVEFGDEILSFLDTLEEPVSNDLGEEVKRYLCEDCSGDDEPTVSETARHFAEWQKAKMMEEAYEEEVQELYQDDDGIHCCVSVGTDYKPGTIVYVITIPKEEEQ